MQQQYTSHIFDCDGVLLDNTASKALAFYKTAYAFGFTHEQSQAFVEYHLVAGSTGRQDRIDWFFDKMCAASSLKESFARELDKQVLQAVKDCHKVKGIENYLRTTRGRKIVVSGVEQQELVNLLEYHGLARYFKVGNEYLIYGTTSKSETLQHLILTGIASEPATYYGDEESDMLAAQTAGIDFTLVYGQSLWTDWKHPGIKNIVPDFEVWKR